MLCIKCGNYLSPAVVTPKCPACEFNLSNDPFCLFGDYKELILPASNNSIQRKIGTKRPSFFMPVEDIFTLTGRGTAVVGKVLFGRINLGDKVEVILQDGERLKTVITGIEMFKKQLDHALEGDSVGILLRGVKKEDIIGAQALVNPDADILHKKYRGSLYVLKKEEGGKHRPVFDYYKPHLRLVTKEYRGLITFDRLSPTPSTGLTETGGNPPVDVMLTPGCSTGVHVEFDTPTACFPGMRFDVHEGDSVTVAKLSIEAGEE